jgi:hypothetical protein
MNDETGDTLKNVLRKKFDQKDSNLSRVIIRIKGKISNKIESI